MNAVLAVVAVASIEVIAGAAMIRFSTHQAMPNPHSELASVSAASERIEATDALSMAQWVARSGDAGRRPFVIVDKAHARVMAFKASGELRSSSPALLGLAHGDDSVPGIGSRKVADVRPEERITPAGRFIARRGHNLDGEDVVWVDYDAAVSMHRVRSTQESERRLQRLATPTIDDNRISYGCINLPAAFYDEVIDPMTRAAPVVIYVLPESRSIADVFALRKVAKAPNPS
ncbi:MAG TPA: L,D-transpeptidase [Rhizobacter sp.]|nr:L,D-transpeptidase [Rhizobacter sp.]